MLKGANLKGGRRPSYWTAATESVQVVFAASQSIWLTKQTYFACYKTKSTPEGLSTGS